MTKVNQDNRKETELDIFPWEIFKSGIIAPYLQNGKLFKCLLNFISWEVLPQKLMIAVSEEKCPSFNFIQQMLKEIAHI